MSNLLIQSLHMHYVKSASVSMDAAKMEWMETAAVHVIWAGEE